MAAAARDDVTLGEAEIQRAVDFITSRPGDSGRWGIWHVTVTCVGQQACVHFPEEVQPALIAAVEERLGLRMDDFRHIIFTLKAT